MIYEDVVVVNEGSTCSLLARVTDTVGTVLTQSDISSIEYQIYPEDSTTAVVGATSLTVSSVIYDTLQTHAAWIKDTTGYNFRHEVSGAALGDQPAITFDPDVTYIVEHKFVLADPPSTGTTIRTNPFRISVHPLKSV